MKNTKKITLLIALVSLIVIGLIGTMSDDRNIEIAPTDVPADVPADSPNDTSTASATQVAYTNTTYGFTFSLPESWRGYTIVQKTWTGNPLKASSAPQTGITIVLRNPKWTPQLPYQDIPVLVFTLAQWESYMAEDFSVSAAPIQAQELGRNNAYVLALPARWNFDFSEGYEDATAIVESKPLTAFTVRTGVSE